MKTLNSINFLFFSILFISLIGFSSCGDDKDDIGNCNTNFSIVLEAELDAITATGTAFGNDPTTENCNAYKTAFNNYLTALESLEGCYRENGLGDEFELSIEEARADINDLDC